MMLIAQNLCQRAQRLFVRSISCRRTSSEAFLGGHLWKPVGERFAKKFLVPYCVQISFGQACRPCSNFSQRLRWHIKWQAFELSHVRMLALESVEMILTLLPPLGILLQGKKQLP